MEFWKAGEYQDSIKNIVYWMTFLPLIIIQGEIIYNHHNLIGQKYKKKGR